MSQNHPKFEIQRPVPVDKEVSWNKSLVIMSKADALGRIEYANEAFIDVSGYEDYELISQPHNIIRHPDMPKVIFKCLWDELKKGNNFHAIVKNMAKSGRYYWVITDFEVIKDDHGKILNYIGRRKSVPEEVISKYIEPLYKRLLQIETVSGIDASEKYLKGYLEEKNKSYIDFVQDIVSSYTKMSNSDSKNKKSFFARFFS
ncbi:PAS domain S-box-containing protein [Flavobacterium croceum DSM 17960]|uniref:PAS domain S-box-containing protein n=1 Tax=Flavobacterium croceum DSM 17960 TaxID=1121886 RepID=A0A2S4N651_9FLAO|nr:PAS domain-containing protein [Flavobacterium croceum]POS01192.1 PAS domain S-box-containing protein [Flavobacterium croceum DSM 17960]